MRSAIVALIFILAPLYASGNASETILHINKLLTEGKRVAILIIDMQTRTERLWVPAEKNRIISEQIEVLNAFSDRSDVLFVDINMAFQGETLSGISQSIKDNELRRSFVKMDSDAFRNRSIANGSELENMITGSLGEELRNLKTTDIVPMGCFSDRCVYDTAQGAAREGFSVHVDQELLIVSDQNLMMRGSSGRAADIAKARLQQILQAARAWEKLKEEIPEMKFIPAETDKQKTCFS